MVGSCRPNEQDEAGWQEKHCEGDPPNVYLLIVSLCDGFLEAIPILIQSTDIAHGKEALAVSSSDPAIGNSRVKPVNQPIDYFEI